VEGITLIEAGQEEGYRDAISSNITGHSFTSLSGWKVIVCARVIGFASVQLTLTSLVSLCIIR